MWRPNYPGTICSKDYFPHWIISVSLLKISCKCMSLCLDSWFYSLDFYVCSYTSTTLDYCSFIVKSQSWIVSAPTLFFSLKIAYILDLYIFFKLGLYFCDPLIFISRLNFFAYSENLSIQLLLDLLIWICLVAQSCPILYNPVDCSLPGSSVHRIL